MYKNKSKTKKIYKITFCTSKGRVKSFHTSKFNDALDEIERRHGILIEIEEYRTHYNTIEMIENGGI